MPHVRLHGGGGWVEDDTTASSAATKAAAASSSSTTSQSSTKEKKKTSMAASASVSASSLSQLLPPYYHHRAYDPRATALKPLLSTTNEAESSGGGGSTSNGCHHDYLSLYTLPPTILGRTDYRPTLKKNTRIVAFGDVHGDISALRSFLITAKVLDPTSTNKEPRWSGGKTICIQTGDVLDRGDDKLACYRLLATLARQADTAGGALLLLYGNHESLNAAGLFQYATAGGNAEFERDIGYRIDYNFGSHR